MDEVEPGESAEADQSTETADLGNLRPSEKTAVETDHFLVMVDINRSGVSVRRVEIQACPIISDNRCEIELNTATFGPDEVVIAEHVRGQTNMDLNIHVAYSSFHPFP